MGQEWIGSGWVQLLARCSLAALLLAAAASKWRYREEFAAAVAPLVLGREGLASAVARLLPWVEAALGALLFAGIATRIAASATAALMALFAAAFWGAQRGAAEVRLRCAPGLNCRANGWSVARNLLLGATALFAAAAPADALSGDHLIFGTPAAPLASWEVVPAGGLFLCVAAAGMLTHALIEVAARPRRPAEA
jgi:uncharacterized membrane protein YphA (DoxX/SURF4 family)